MVGAGLFGFMINPPIALYFMQGLNTTPLHGHAALFGVYGMLGIGLMLVCLRAMEPRAEWKEGWLRFAFWGMNAGLFIMCVGSLLPGGAGADLGLRRTRLLVRAQHRIPRPAVHADAPLAARAGRHDIRHRRAGAGGLRVRRPFGLGQARLKSRYPMPSVFPQATRPVE